jgi:hypothetical protein
MVIITIDHTPIVIDRGPVSSAVGGYKSWSENFSPPTSQPERGGDHHHRPTPSSCHRSPVPRGPRHPATRRANAKIRRAIYPDKDDWKEMVLFRSPLVLRQAVTGLVTSQVTGGASGKSPYGPKR